MSISDIVEPPDGDFGVQDANPELLDRAARLRQAVKAAGGNKAVARRAGMPVGTLNNYLTGRDMKAAALVALADVCHVTVDWLATGRAAPKFTPQAAAPGRPPALFSIVDMELLNGAIQGAIDLFHKRNAEGEGVNFARVVCILYDEMKKRADDARAAAAPPENTSVTADLTRK